MDYSVALWSLIAISTTVFQDTYGVDPIPHVINSEETITVEAGQTVSLECQVENGAKSKVKWEICRELNDVGRCVRFSGLTSKTKTKYHFDYGVKREGLQTYFLYIYNIEPEQSGTYHCTVRNAMLALRATDFINVDVYAKPKIDYLRTTADLIAREGPPVTLNCAARGSPEPLVIWQRVGGSKIPGGGLNNPNNTLVIPNCDQEAKGQYSCIASNKYGEVHHTIKLQCLGEPRIQANPSMTSQKVGYQSKLMCTVDSSPPVTRIWWTKDNLDILSDDGRYETVTMQAALGRVITKLVILHGVNTADYHCSFSCHARNVFGTVNTTLTITEADTPQPYDGSRILKAKNSATSVQSSYTYIIVTLATLHLIMSSVSDSLL